MIISATEPEGPHASTAALIEEIESYLKRYVSFVDGSNAFALALWVVGTHVYEVFDAYGYLVISASTKRAGKTRLMELLSFIAARAHHSADITPAALFAIVEDEKPTLMIDEAERFAASQKGFSRNHQLGVSTWWNSNTQAGSCSTELQGLLSKSFRFDWRPLRHPA
jgi:hypothetical protein